VCVAEQAVGSPLSMHDPYSVGPWTLESRLGAGGMGVVFYGRAPGRGAAAVKVIRPGLLDAPATRDRFRREVAILRSVRDIHICEFLDADLESEPAWLAIEYVSGPVLRDEILENGPLAEAEWWRLAHGLAQALAVLEVHRITHRDLKPGNVILNERGPVLIDFGIAHPEDATALTATGLVTGSPAWLSPEQANLEQTGPASDIFTLGSLLAFAATGRPPFGEGASVAVLVAITTKEPDLAGLDPARTALLRRTLAKDPMSRPTARQILDLTRGSASDAQSALLTDPGLTRARPSPQPPSETTMPDGIDFVDREEPPVAQAVAASTAAAPSAPPKPVQAQPAPIPVAAPTSSVASSQPVAPAQAPPPASSGGRSFFRWLGILALVAAVVLGAWWGVGLITGGQYGGTPPGSNSSNPPSARKAPDAPPSDVLRSGDWLLASYRLINDGTDLSISGTISNTGSTAGSADLTVWVYLADGTSLGSVETTVTDVPAGGSVQVNMTGDALWAPGAKVVLLEAD
jgi:serine/threonine protein kinase